MMMVLLNSHNLGVVCCCWLLLLLLLLLSSLSLTSSSSSSSTSSSSSSSSSDVYYSRRTSSSSTSSSSIRSTSSSSSSIMNDVLYDDHPKIRRLLLQDDVIHDQLIIIFYDFVMDVDIAIDILYTSIIIQQQQQQQERGRNNNNNNNNNDDVFLIYRYHSAIKGFSIKGEFDHHDIQMILSNTNVSYIEQDAIFTGIQQQETTTTMTTTTIEEELQQQEQEQQQGIDEYEYEYDEYEYDEKIYNENHNKNKKMNARRRRRRSSSSSTRELKTKNWMTTTTIKEQYNVKSWGIDRIDDINITNNHIFQYKYTGSNVDICIMDTGVLTTHDEFKVKIDVVVDSTTDDSSSSSSDNDEKSTTTTTSSSRVICGFNAISHYEDCTDYHGHGTHVAGIAAGNTYGVAKNANIINVKVLDKSGMGTYSGIVAGIEYIVSRKQKKSPNNIVANLSWGGQPHTSLEEAIHKAVKNNILIVAAGGNYNTDACNYHPGSYNTVLTVGSTTHIDQRYYTSNYGSCIDIFAPGHNIQSSYSKSNHSIKNMTGTSMASPHVAGYAAQYFQARPNWTPAKIKSAILDDATVGVLDSNSIQPKSPNLLLYTGGILSRTTSSSSSNSGNSHDNNNNNYEEEPMEDDEDEEDSGYSEEEGSSAGSRKQSNNDAAVEEEEEEEEESLPPPVPTTIPTTIPTTTIPTTTIPTPSPTPKPTRRPKPTRKPTRRPKPTSNPTTPSPTPKPTRRPRPTPNPTPKPTWRPKPTPNPTPKPTRRPKPTPNPTPKPTRRPKPTSVPTSIPTTSLSPTIQPTDTPTTSLSPSICDTTMTVHLWNAGTGKRIRRLYDNDIVNLCIADSFSIRVLVDECAVPDGLVLMLRDGELNPLRRNDIKNSSFYFYLGGKNPNNGKVIPIQEIVNIPGPYVFVILDPITKVRTRYHFTTIECST